MKYRHIAALILLAGTATAAGAREATQFKVNDIEVSVNGDRLDLSLDINPKAVNPGRDRELILYPVVMADNGLDSVVMPAIRIAGRNRYYSHLRNHDLAEGERVYSAGSGETIEYRRSVPFAPWMQRCHVDMRANVGRCCDPVVYDGDTPLARVDMTPRPWQPEFNYVALTGDESIERTAEGSAFIDFVVNRTEIKESYRGNRAELAKIIATIDVVKNDPDAVITRVTVKGYASPEGSYDNNVRLAIGRTDALKEYVRSHYSFDPAIMSSDYEPEDWEGLQRRLAGLDLPHRDEIMAIAADTSLAPDPRNAEIQRRYPAEYKFLLDSIYPALRHSDYTVNYKIRTYVDIEELKKVYASNPANLRPVDFERIAATYPQGSPEYEQVYMTAARIHPADCQANINAANIAMRHGRLDEAGRMLDFAGDSPEASYSRATLAAMRGDLERAESLFDHAAGRGLDAAAAERDRVRAERLRPRVTYLITPDRQ